MLRSGVQRDGWSRAQAEGHARSGAEAAERLAAGIEAHTNAKMSPFERTLIGVLEDIRDALRSGKAS